MLSFRWWTPNDNTLKVLVDSDRAGCPNTRFSTSDGVLKIGEKSLRHWSVTQATISLSSAEGEAKASTKGCVEVSTPRVEGLTAETHSFEHWTDSSSTRAISHRLGPGIRAKHLEEQTMWTQQISKQGVLIVHTNSREPARQTCRQNMCHGQF